MNTRHSLIVIVALALAGCDQVNQKLGLEDPGKKEARLDTEGKAVGSACRHSGRAIEDCYAIYSWLPKAGIFEGWREMDGYMRENKIETIAPQLPPPEAPGKKKKKAVTDEAAKSMDRSRPRRLNRPKAPKRAKQSTKQTARRHQNRHPDQHTRHQPPRQGRPFVIAKLIRADTVSYSRP